MNRVSVGQSWSVVILGPGGGAGRMNVRIESIESGIVRGKTDRGRSVSLRLRVLQYGQRGARLNGVPERIDLPSAEPELPRTVTIHEPKGFVRAHSRAREALRLQQERGFSIEKLSRYFKVSVGAMNGWLRNARDAQREERQARHG